MLPSTRAASRAWGIGGYATKELRTAWGLHAKVAKSERSSDQQQGSLIVARMAVCSAVGLGNRRARRPGFVADMGVSDIRLLLPVSAAADQCEFGEDGKRDLFGCDGVDVQARGGADFL